MGCSVSVRFYSMLPPRVHEGTFWTSKASNIRGPPGRQVGVELPRNVLKHHGPINHCASSIRLVSALCNKWSSSTHTHAHMHACTRTQYVKMLVALLVVVQVTLIIHSTHSILSQSRFEYRFGLKWLRPTAYRKQSTCAVNRTYSSHCVWSLASPTTMCFRSMPEAFMPNDCVSKQFAIHHEVREGRGLVDT